MGGPTSSSVTLIATSCLLRWQQRGDYDQVAKGPILRPDKVGIQHYWVATTPEWMPNVPGIAGEFFEILPTDGSLEDGMRRSHFWVHVDANYPGSAGCPVIVNPSAFDDFCKRIAEFKAQGIAKIPLQIDYPG
ncbi:hypothetical protein IQ266_11300 [filamentous cyanobacterium LEGE 11480]|uniref:Uncharacterized protein n=1 Tax=Romeriopsis navalis LEGE 11480 TaxID=2777977 RepID=A0A928Z3S9_9CYAN|nr:hypothetical protein [Romeriopsis navalis]MBE9030317.1 hypothetical protein [Romeriopsis navalis LEGE 11480]